MAIEEDEQKHPLNTNHRNKGIAVNHPSRHVWSLLSSWDSIPLVIQKKKKSLLYRRKKQKERKKKIFRRMNVVRS